MLLILLALVIFAGSGGVRRVGNIFGFIIPVFVVLYLGMGLWILLNNFQNIPSVIKTVFNTAFTGHAAMGAFIGSSTIRAISQGVHSWILTRDVRIGYES